MTINSWSFCALPTLTSGWRTDEMTQYNRELECGLARFYLLLLHDHVATMSIMEVVFAWSSLTSLFLRSTRIEVDSEQPFLLQFPAIFLYVQLSSSYFVSILSRTSMASAT